MGSPGHPITKSLFRRFSRLIVLDFFSSGSSLVPFSCGGVPKDDPSWWRGWGFLFRFVIRFPVLFVPVLALGFFFDLGLGFFGLFVAFWFFGVVIDLLLVVIKLAVDRACFYHLVTYWFDLDILFTLFRDFYPLVLGHVRVLGSNSRDRFGRFGVIVVEFQVCIFPEWADGSRRLLFCFCFRHYSC